MKPSDHIISISLLQLQRSSCRIGYINKLVWFSYLLIGRFKLSIKGFNVLIPCVGGGVEDSGEKKLTQTMPERHFESSVYRLRCLRFPTRFPLPPSYSSCGGTVCMQIWPIMKQVAEHP